MKTAMNATNTTTMALMMIAGMGCSSLPKFDIDRPVHRTNDSSEGRYQQNGRAIDTSDMVEKLSLEPEAAPHVEKARLLAVFSGIFLGAGSGLVSVPLGQWAADEYKPNWTLAIIGGVATIIGLPLGVASNYKLDEAVDAHNLALLKANAPSTKSTSAANWKPGQSAGVPSAFGFVMGSSKKDAASACRKAGHQWSETDGLFRCSGLPSKKIVGAWAQIEFTSEKLARLEILVMPPNDASGWVGSFKNTESALSNVYGKPAQRSFVVPDECKAEEVFLGCVAEGKVTGSALWYPDADHAAVLDIVPAPLPSTSILRVKIARRPPLPAVSAP